MKHSMHPAMTGAACPSRRRFVQGLAAGGALSALGLFQLPSWAAGFAYGQANELSGQEIDLVISELPVNFTGRPAVATAINGQVPGPTLRWREGDTVTLRVTNRLKVHSSIHWHGIVLPTDMDGVPGLSFDGIAPGETFVYRFTVRQSGTYWYHSHSGFQEQTGMFGAIVIEPRNSIPPMREHVVMLSDWSDEAPEKIEAKLKTFDGYYNYAKPTLRDLFDQARKEGWSKAWQERMMWDAMRMNARDLADVSGATYTYLTNGASPAMNWTGLYTPGEKVKLRFINAAAMSYFDVRIPGLKMTVVAADGQDVHPVTVDEFRIGVAETYDVIVEPEGDQAYTLFAQAMDRSGYARGTLAPRMGMQAEVPPLDAIPTLTMADMGMEHADHGGNTADHGSHVPAPSNAHAGHDAHAGHGQTASVDDSGMLRVTRHPDTENNPGVAMQAQVVSTRLDDPGIGLRDNGRRVLTYADLRTHGGWLNEREPSRTIELHLTGNMARYMWSIDGIPADQAPPIRLDYGESVRFVLVNDTMMEHPFHLHGMWSELENHRRELQVRKHTINAKPGHAVSYRVLADAKGKWAYHCHLSFHMMGMFRVVEVA